MTEDRFWYIVDKLDWKNNQDYKILGSKLLNFIVSKNEIDEIKTFSKKFQKRLIYIFYDASYILLPGRVHFWGGDDSFWDFRAHIVGSGKDVYYSILNNYEEAEKINTNFVENFDYIFLYAHNEYDKKELRINKLNRIIDEDGLS